jgi:hypothetical protein
MEDAAVVATHPHDLLWRVSPGYQEFYSSFGEEEWDSVWAFADWLLSPLPSLVIDECKDWSCDQFLDQWNRYNS